MVSLAGLENAEVKVVSRAGGIADSPAIVESVLPKHNHHGVFLRLGQGVVSHAGQDAV